MDKRFEGLTVADLEAAIEMIKAREAEKANAEIDDARMTMIDAAIKYLLAIGVMTQEEVEETDWNDIVEDIKSIEAKLPELKKMLKFYDSMTSFSVPKIKVKVNGHEANDDEMDILKKFIASQM